MSNIISFFSKCFPDTKSNPHAPSKQAVASILPKTIPVAVNALATSTSSAEGKVEAKALESKAVSMSFAQRDSYKDPSVKRMTAVQMKSLDVARPFHTELTKREYRLEADEAKVNAKMNQARLAAMEDQTKLRERMLKARKDIRDRLLFFSANLEEIHRMLPGSEEIIPMPDVRALLSLNIDTFSTEFVVQNINIITHNILNTCKNKSAFYDFLNEIVAKLPDKQREITLTIFENFKSSFNALSLANLRSGAIFESLKDHLSSQDSTAESGDIRYYDTSSNALDLTNLLSANGAIFESLKDHSSWQDSVAERNMDIRHYEREMDIRHYEREMDIRHYEREMEIRHYDTSEVKAATSTATTEVKVEAAKTKYADVKVESAGCTVMPSAIATISPKNEDRFLTGNFSFNVQGKPVGVEVRAIFDGHGGAACATFARDSLLPILKEKLKYYCEGGMDTVRLHQSLKEIFPDISRDFINAHPGNDSGCTANACLYFPQTKTLYVVNAGNSCAFLLRKSGEVLKLSKDEKASDSIISKEARIRGIERGAEIIQKITVGRSLGNAYLGEGVSARGAVVRYENIDKEDIVFQCTEGATGAADTQLMGAHAHAWRQEPGSSLLKIVGRIAAGAALGGSEDDITVMASQFGMSASASV